MAELLISAYLILCFCSLGQRLQYDACLFSHFPETSDQLQVAISRSHLLPKQRQLHALEKEAGSVSAHVVPCFGSNPVKPAVGWDQGDAAPILDVSEEALEALVTRWTAESGVRPGRRHGPK